jgi:3-oxoacyl-[acyl-carrier-protein] synthase II
MSRGVRQVAVTGLGLISPLGSSAQATFGAMLRGENAVRLLDPADGGRVRLGAPVPSTALDRMTARERRSYDRAVLLALQAAREAWDDADRPTPEPERLAVSVSSGLGGLDTIMSLFRHWQESGGQNPPVGTVPRIMPNAVAAVIAIEYQARGGTYSPVSACASGADALALGGRLILSGEADVVIAGGAEAILSPVTLNAFAALRALSTRHAEPNRASRPFDRDRDGFVIGEGAGILVLETLSHARARGARVHALLRGMGTSSDGASLVTPDPSGVGARQAMTKALHQAECEPTAVAAVSAHATGTPLGDHAEGLALGQVFASQVPVTALKSMTGHLIGASGPLAVVTACLSIAQRVVPGTRNCDHCDPGIELDIARDGPRTLPSRGDLGIMVNSFGFGGQNVSLLVGSP